MRDADRTASLVFSMASSAETKVATGYDLACSGVTGCFAGPTYRLRGR